MRRSKGKGLEMVNRRDFLGAGVAAAALSATGRTVAAETAASSIKSPVNLGPVITDFEVRTNASIGRKKASFYIDDAIWFLRDITRQRPKSAFDHPFLKALKEAHDRWGMKVQINLFHRTDFFYGMDEFSLADVTDAYKDEWQANRDWLRFGFHSLQEFPDYPFVNVSYEDVKKVCDLIFGNVRRFAGEGMVANAVVPHWLPISKDGCRALADCGMKVVSCSYGYRHAYTGDPSVLPYGHSFRLLNSRKPETALCWRGTRNTAINSSISGYNHLLADQAAITHGTFSALFDKATGICIKRFSNGPCINLFPLDEIAPAFDKIDGADYICYGTHEQYFFSDYFAYQPDTAAKFHAAAKWIAAHGYEYVFIEDTVS